MLRLQRLLAFTSRVHTYLLLLLAFFFLAFCAGSYFLVDETYIDLLVKVADMVAWTLYFFGAWVLALVLLVWITSGVFPWKQLVLDLLRLACGFGISFIIASVQHLVREGLVIGF